MSVYVSILIAIEYENGFVYVELVNVKYFKYVSVRISYKNSIIVDKEIKYAVLGSSISKCYYTKTYTYVYHPYSHAD